MNKSRARDQAIAEQLFGSEVTEASGILVIMDNPDDLEELPSFSSSPTDAVMLFEVVADMAKMESSVRCLLASDGSSWTCNIGIVSTSSEDICTAVTDCVIQYFGIVEGVLGVNKEIDRSWQ